MKAFNMLILVAFLAASLSGCWAESIDYEEVNLVMAPAQNGGNVEELVAFVEVARDYVLGNGQEAALAAFGDREGEFVKGELYVFAYDFNGTLLAHPYLPELVGRNNLDLVDPNGMPMIKNSIKVARRGGGFIYNVYPNPVRDNKEELKMLYALKVDEDLWLGAGIYLADEPPYFSPRALENLTVFVEEAQKYALENGREKALMAFNDPAGEFVRGEFYVFAYDFNGTILALPFQPELIGTNRMDIEDVNGVAFIQDMVGLAGTGNGTTYYIYPNPAKNMTHELKLSHVVRVDDGWWLGAGMYGDGASKAFSSEKPTSREELVDFVQSAVSYALVVGREKAVEEFMDLDGPWVRDDVYVFAADFNGTSLTLPYLPEAVGTNRLDLQNDQGVYINREMRDIAINGSGFYEYDWRNPITNQTEPKVSFVSKVDETWWLGAGIYV